MAYKVLYRTYRPSKFNEVIGQEYIIKTLLNAIKLNKIAHAYLFCGPRGIGKTSIAKLFAKAVNCEKFIDEACDNCDSCKAYLSGNHPDIIELDAASNNGVDDIRDIVEQVNYAPILSKYKIYIIDEVHMLTTSAFNALLKTLEEPPAHVIFILATTDPQKIIPTVLSRCQRYNFMKIKPFEIKKQLENILNKETIKYDDEALDEISRLAEGSLRDALSILEQALAYNDEGIFINDIQKIFGLLSTKEKKELLIAIHNDHKNKALSKLHDIYNNGADLKRLVNDLLEIIKEVLIYSDEGNTRLLNILQASEAQEILNRTSREILFDDAKYLEEVLNKDKQNQNFLLYLELCILKMANTFKDNIMEDKKEEIKEEINIKEEERIEEIKDIKNDLLLSILLTASKEEKINDEIIYNRLDLYKLEVEKRKFFELLNGTKIFASNKDAIIIHGEETKINNINDKDNNKEIYRFILEEFGIDKMVYGIKDIDTGILVKEYRKAIENKKDLDIAIKKYDLPKEETKEDKLKKLFGDIKVEE